MEIVIYVILTSAIIGGFIAYTKNDYFSRGFFICLITSVFGIIAIILSPKSKAKEGDKKDYHGWPKYGSYAVLFIMGFSFLLYILLLII